jgi:hypothetical protein
VKDCASFLEGAGVGREALAAAAEMKRLAGQINVTIHALGILLCLPHILEPGERVEYVSLGAGNTGREFDLETNLRVAEFKFIRWRGGAESIRQNSVFKDYLLLAEHPTAKRKYLYLLGTEHALKFLRGGRALSSVLIVATIAARSFIEMACDETSSSFLSYASAASCSRRLLSSCTKASKLLSRFEASSLSGCWQRTQWAPISVTGNGRSG